MKYMQQLVVYHLGTFEKYRDGKPAVGEYNELTKEMKEIWSIKRKDWTDEQADRYAYLQDERREFTSVLISGNGKKTAEWTTASGFPVVYNACRTDDLQCKGTINSQRISHQMVVPTDIPDIHKFMCGISPNYIHSQDAAHMALVIDQWNGTFGAVHDSFSTHACDVEDMLALTKDVFVNMYNVDNYFDKIQQDITGGTDSIQQPTLGSLEIQEVYDSDFFFA